MYIYKGVSSHCLSLCTLMRASPLTHTTNTYIFGYTKCAISPCCEPWPLKQPKPASPNGFHKGGIRFDSFALLYTHLSEYTWGPCGRIASYWKTGVLSFAERMVYGAVLYLFVSHTMWHSEWGLSGAPPSDKTTHGLRSYVTIGQARPNPNWPDGYSEQRARPIYNDRVIGITIRKFILTWRA
jgi:hypothetical protein